MEIGDYLKELLVKKTGTADLKEYQPYIINRFLSFLSPQAAEAVNHANEQHLTEDKEKHYKLMLAMLPKLKTVSLLRYMKDPTVAKKKAEKNAGELLSLAANYETSKARILEMQQLSDDLS